MCARSERPGACSAHATPCSPPSPCRAPEIFGSRRLFPVFLMPTAVSDGHSEKLRVGTKAPLLRYSAGNRAWSSPGHQHKWRTADPLFLPPKAPPETGDILPVNGVAVAGVTPGRIPLINIGEADSDGVYTGSFKTYALSGFVRNLGESDDSVNRLATRDGYLRTYAFVVYWVWRRNSVGVARLSSMTKLLSEVGLSRFQGLLTPIPPALPVSGLIKSRLVLHDWISKMSKQVCLHGLVVSVDAVG
ncbi:MAG: hypothetical protein BJ554DRAFT_6217 [Olpidium bornovanus]|uniref:Uncharacterized protein n=1 Tax=Olpidium bornovanus TaxID=278681 RepID=A0A8H7ZYC0_9FUNG|nr:MAG: hypothetical protein BJ554DRAFT_6217 [Olpidium bornovanus]